MAFQTPLDIGNQALQHLGQSKLTSFQNNAQRGALECFSSYDTARLAELSNHTWMFSIRKARVRGITQSMQLWTPPTYAAGTTYTVGQAVTYQASTYQGAVSYPWILQTPSATGQQPDISPQWSHYFGAMTCDVFDNLTIYAAGELALVPETWLISATYPNAAIVNYQGVFYVSLAAGNVGNTPSSTVGTWWVVWVPPETTTIPTVGAPQPAPNGVWASGTTYALGNVVQYTSLVTGNIQYYISLGNSNIGHEPDTSPTFWSLWGTTTSMGVTNPIGPFIWTSFNGGVSIFMSIVNNNGSNNPSVTPSQVPFVGSPNWTLVGGTIAQLTVLWPAGTGYMSDSTTLNLYRLPFGWLRPNDFQQEQRNYHPWLGALYGSYPRDFVYYDQYFTSYGQGPWDVEFVADIADVTRMHPQFCHCVAINLAQIMDPALTDGKNAARLAVMYNKKVGDATRVDAILQGTPDEPLEEFVRVRF